MAAMPSRKAPGPAPDAAGRQYSEYVDDLEIPVPGGTVSVARSYERGRWEVRVADVLYSMGPAPVSAGGVDAPTPLIYNGTAYTLNGKKLSAPGGGVMGVVPLSRVAAGTYRTAPAALEYFAKRTDGTYEWIDGKGNERSYDIEGRLTSRRFHGMLIATYHYDATSGLLTSVKDCYDRVVMVLAYEDGRLVTARDERAGASVADSAKPAFHYTYVSGRLETVTGASGAKLTYGYDDSGRLKSITTTLPTTTPAQQPPPPDHVVSFDYQVSSSNGSLPAVPDYRGAPPTAPATWPAAPAGWIIQGNTSYGYSINAFLTRVSHSTGESESYVYTFNESTKTYRAQITDALGRQEEVQFDANGNPASKSINGVSVFQAQQDDRTRVSYGAVYDRGARERTREEFDEFGAVIRRVNPDGGVEQFEYDPVHRKVTRHTDPLGLVTTTTYNDFGDPLVTTETPPADASGGPYAPRVTTRTYVSGKRLLQTKVDPDGRTTVYDYYSVGDGLHRADLVRRTYFYYGTTSDASRQEVYDYDLYGRLKSKTDARGAATTSVADDYTTTYEYDNAHRVTLERNALGEETRYRYQGPNLIEVEFGATTSPARAGRVTRYAYDSRNRRIAEIRVRADGTGYEFKKWSYDKAGRLQTETNALGQIISRGYDAFGYLASLSMPSSVADQPSVTNYKNDAWGRVLTTTDPVGNVTKTVYGANGQPFSVIEADGTVFARTTAYAYDFLGRVLTKTLSGREETHLGTVAPVVVYTTAYAYTPFGEIVSIGGTRPYATAYTYDAMGRPLTITDARGLATPTDPADYISTYGYHPQSKLLQTFTRGTRALLAYAYDLVGNRVQATDGEGNHRHYRYDALNRLTHESIPLPAGQSLPVDWWTQPRYILTETAYTRFGEVETRRRPTYDPESGQTTYADTDYVYDDFGRLESETTPGGLPVLYGYDLADNGVSARYPVPVSSGVSGYVTETRQRNSQNAALIDWQTDRSGALRQFTYDRALRLQTEINSQGGKITTAYDPLGRLASLRDPAGYTTRVTAYSLLDQPRRIEHPDHTEALARIETRTYDLHGKLLTRAGTGGYPFTLDYDPVGNLKTLVTRYGPGAGAEQTTTWIYNDLNLVWKKRYPDQKEWIYTYDDAGRPETRTDGLGQTTGYDFDAYGLLTTVDYPANPAAPSVAAADVAFTYDQQGRRRTMSDGTGTTRWTYDAAGRPLTEFQPRTGRTLAFTHDGFDQRTRLAVSALGAAPWAVDYTYDAAGRLSTVADSRHPGANPFRYGYPTPRSLADVTALAASAALAEPTRDTYTLATPYNQVIATVRDQLGRILSVAARQANDPLSTIIASHAYVYNAAGLRETETTPAWSRAYGYDEKRQLTSATTEGVASDVHAYAYDAIGNRLSATVSGAADPAFNAATTYVPNLLNQYFEITQGSDPGAVGFTPAYDDNGNQTLGRQGPGAYSSTGQTVTYAYDQENRMVRASTLADGREETYVYDGLGRRVERTLRQGASVVESVRYVYDGWRVVEDLNSANTVVRGYVRGLDLSGTWEGAGGIGGLLAFLEPSDSAYAAATYVHDGNGNVSALVDAAHSLVASYRYSPFGEVLASSGTVSEKNRYRFSAKEQDGFTGLCYYGFRYYNSSTGRWLSGDPIGELGGMNLYELLGNDCINRLDYLGMQDANVYFFRPGESLQDRINTIFEENERRRQGDELQKAKQNAAQAAQRARDCNSCTRFVDTLINSMSWGVAGAGLPNVASLYDGVGFALYGSEGPGANSPVDGFRPELISGGQNSDVYRHLYSYAGSTMADYPFMGIPALSPAWLSMVGPWHNSFSPFGNLTEDLRQYDMGLPSAPAEVRDDFAGMDAGEMMRNALRGEMTKDELREKLRKLLCR